MKQDEYDLGMGRSLREIEESRKALEPVDEAAKAARAALDKELNGIRSELTRTSDEAAVDAYLRSRGADFELTFWNKLIEKTLVGLEGQAAVQLAQAQALRWQREMTAAAELTKLDNERVAYAANPQVYKARRYLEVLVTGLTNARKYFIAFNPEGRNVHLRIQAEEKLRPSAATVRTAEQKP
ncbi:MAG: hypothetical protein HZB38_13155 [Planctomycetes bacterium]|nr:hypothetical protein [Planctomycetota bacterium]